MAVCRRCYEWRLHDVGTCNPDLLPFWFRPVRSLSLFSVTTFITISPYIHHIDLCPSPPAAWTWRLQLTFSQFQSYGLHCSSSVTTGCCQHRSRGRAFPVTKGGSYEHYFQPTNRRNQHTELVIIMDIRQKEIQYRCFSDRLDPRSNSSIVSFTTSTKFLTKGNTLLINIDYMIQNLACLIYTSYAEKICSEVRSKKFVAEIF